MFSEIIWWKNIYTVVRLVFVLRCMHSRTYRCTFSFQKPHANRKISRKFICTIFKCPQNKITIFKSNESLYKLKPSIWIAECTSEMIADLKCSENPFTSAIFVDEMCQNCNKTMLQINCNKNLYEISRATKICSLFHWLHESRRCKYPSIWAYV